MYSSSYSSPSKRGLQPARPLRRPRRKGCDGLRLVFFFSSLIQSLIIVSLVLFLVYGKPQDSASEARVHDLEGSFNRLTAANQALREQRVNLTRALNATVTSQRKREREQQYLANYSIIAIQSLRSKQMLCEQARMSAKCISSCPPPALPASGDKALQMRLQQCDQQQKLLQSNFTQSSQHLRQSLEAASRERDGFHLELLSLRREHASLGSQLEHYGRKCKEDFVRSLGGIGNVSRAFLEKIDTLLPRVIPFQLTCEKQRDHLEQIRSNCSALSREVENKFQRYLDNVGSQVSRIQGESSRLHADNLRLTEDLRWCRANRSGLIVEQASALRADRARHDQQAERMLMEVGRLRGQKELQEALVAVRDGRQPSM